MLTLHVFLHAHVHAFPQIPDGRGSNYRQKARDLIVTPGLSAPGTLHLNDITQTHRQNNTYTVKYKQDRLSDTTNRWPDR